MLKPIPQDTFFRVRPPSELMMPQHYINQQNSSTSTAQFYQQQISHDLFFNSTNNFEDMQNIIGIDSLPGSINPHSTTNIQTEIHFCPICGQSFLLPNLLLDHMHLAHQNEFLLSGLENSLSFSCQQCDELFRTSLELDEHMRTMHQSLKFLKCSNCNLFGISPNPGGDSKCLHCGAPYSLQTDDTSIKLIKSNSKFLEDNLNNCHTVEKLIENPPMIVSSEPKLEIKEPNKNDKLQISNNSNNTILDNNLKPNAGTPTNRRHKCSDCDKTFKTIATLSFHKKVHTGEVEIQTKDRPYVCSYCSKTFTQSNTLKQHVRIHTGEKPFQCTFCEKSFSVKDYLTKHIRTHTGEKPYNCTFCDKKFTQRSALTVHTSKLHPI